MESVPLPEVQPFYYIYIPSDPSQPVEERLFTGNSEESLRSLLINYFTKVQLSDGQKNEMKSKLLEESDKQAAKARAAANNNNNINNNNNNNSNVEELGDDGTPIINIKNSIDSTDNNNNNNNNNKNKKELNTTLLEAAISQSTYEIIPVIIPLKNNNFIGSSLYIDDAGRFKELNINYRASKLCQRDIRGDAFLLSNYDDPCLDNWKRIDCKMSNYNEIMEFKGNNNNNNNLNNNNNNINNIITGDDAQMGEIMKLRENESKKISPEDAKKALENKIDGNNYFSSGDYNNAIIKYSELINNTDGRIDLLENEEEMLFTRISGFLNRSLCFYKLKQYNNSEKDALKVVFIISNYFNNNNNNLNNNNIINNYNIKGLYRLAAARVMIDDYIEGGKALDKCEELNNNNNNNNLNNNNNYNNINNDIVELRKVLKSRQADYLKKEKKRFANMFQ